MSSDAALDSFSVMIDVDSDVSSFATGLDEDAGGDNAPLAAAEVWHLLRKRSLHSGGVSKCFTIRQQSAL